MTPVWPKLAGENVKSATAHQPVLNSQCAEESAEAKTAKLSSVIASSAGALVSGSRPSAPNQGDAGHESKGNNKPEPSVLSPPRITRPAAGSCEEQSKRIPPGEWKPPLRATAEAAPCPQPVSVRGSKSKDGATTMNKSRAEEILDTTTHTLVDGHVGAGGNLELKTRPRMMSMSGLEGNSERVRPRTTTYFACTERRAMPKCVEYCANEPPMRGAFVQEERRHNAIRNPYRLMIEHPRKQT